VGKSRILRVVWAGAILSVGCAAIALASIVADAQIKPPPPKPNERQVYLVRQDQSDCTNANVPGDDSPSVDGNIWLSRQTDGTTLVKVALTASPNTTYHFFLKCVRYLGDIETDGEGEADTAFSFKTNEVGDVYGFDSFPETGRPGNTFQSAQVKFQ
jgi:hypothetical protein